jgi:hypothetical protein
MNKNTAIFILLTPVRYTFSVIAFVVTAVLLGINWCLTGEYDHSEGMIGFVCAVIPGWVLEHVNNPLIRLHESFRPVAWSWSAAIAKYRKLTRWWADKFAHDYEYRNAVKNNIVKAKNAWERKFWTVVARQGERLTQRLADEKAAELTK